MKVKRKKNQDNQRKVEEIRKEINNSNISKEQKQELLKLLEKLTNQNKTADNSTKKPSTNTNYYWAWILVGIGMVLVGIVGYLISKKRKK